MSVNLQSAYTSISTGTGLSTTNFWNVSEVTSNTQSSFFAGVIFSLSFLTPLPDFVDGSFAFTAFALSSISAFSSSALFLKVGFMLLRTSSDTVVL